MCLHGPLKELERQARTKTNNQCFCDPDSNTCECMLFFLDYCLKLLRTVMKIKTSINA